MAIIVQPAACPHCGETGRARFLVAPLNILKSLLIPFWTGLFILTMMAEVCDIPPLPVRWRWRCRACGRRYSAKMDHREVLPPRPTHPVCRKCEYDLTGNETGVCPECGTRVRG